MGAVLVEGLGDRQRLGAAADALAADVVAAQGAELGGGLAEEPVERREPDRLWSMLSPKRVRKPDDAVLGRGVGRQVRRRRLTGALEGARRFRVRP